MCLTAEAIALFLNLIPSELVETQPGRIVVSAETREAHWVLVDDQWCTMAPQIDRQARLATLSARQD